MVRGHSRGEGVPFPPEAGNARRLEGRHSILLVYMIYTTCLALQGRLRFFIGLKQPKIHQQLNLNPNAHVNHIPNDRREKERTDLTDFPKDRDKTVRSKIV